MKGIFFAALLIPLVGSMDILPLISYFSELQGCIFTTQLDSLNACASSTDKDCYVHGTFMLMKACIKPALFKLFDYLDDPDDRVLTSKTVHDVFQCSIDRSVDEVKPCIDDDGDDEDYLFIDVLTCFFKTFTSALKQCRAVQHNRTTDEL
ncbi:uncharacterized protein LOC144602725 isoform X2 [Rhinoraja longicauda]